MNCILICIGLGHNCFSYSSPVVLRLIQELAANLAMVKDG